MRQPHLLGKDLTRAGRAHCFDETMINTAGTANGGEVRRLTFASSIMRKDWRHIVYTPPGYNVPELRYPVLYLLHGNYGSPDDFIDAGSLKQTADRLIADGRMPPAVIAMPDGGHSWYLNHGDVRMEDAILREFIPHIERTERVIGSRAARVIGGISMGGYGALRYALKHPDMFGAVALMSPAIFADMPHAGSSALCGAPFCFVEADGALTFKPHVWRERAYPALLDGCFERGPPLRFYVDSGAQDEFGIADEARRLYETLRARGQRATFGLRDGTHDWTTWTKALETALPHVMADAPWPMRAGES
jgi:enterochelin esterase-like enzyme